METNIATATENTEIRELSDLERKMHLTGKVVKTSLAGVFVDVGLDVPGVIHISQLQKEHINRVEDVVQEGQTVDVWVRRVIPNKKRLELTMIEPLPLEWREIKKDMVVKGKVVRIEKFGIFVEIGAQRPGLVHVSEITHGYIKDPSDVIKLDEEVEAKVLSVDRRRKQIKLSLKALEEIPAKPTKKKKKGSKPTKEEKESEEELVPTAMEIAFQQAMQRSKTEPTPEEVKPISKENPDDSELDNILDRTLQSRVQATK